MFSGASSSLAIHSSEPFHKQFVAGCGGSSGQSAGRQTQSSSIKSIANAVVTEGNYRKTPHSAASTHRQRNSSVLVTDHHLPNGGGVSASVLHQRLRSLAANDIKRRRRVISSGASANFLYAVALVLAALVFLAHFDSLQRDADNRFVDLERHLPSEVYVWLGDVTHHGVCTAVTAFSIVLVGIRESTTRFTFLLMLLLFSWLVIGALHFFGDVAAISSRDALLTRFAFSALAVAMNLAVIILPKKLKHKIRPNTIYSAFSASSTPLSQCTMASDLDDHSAVDGAEDLVDDGGHRRDAYQSGSNQSADFLAESFCARNDKKHPSTLFNSPPIFNSKGSSAFSTPVKAGSFAFASPFDRRWNAWREQACDEMKNNCNNTANIFVDEDDGDGSSSMMINRNTMVGKGLPYHSPFCTTSTINSSPSRNIFEKKLTPGLSDYYHHPTGSSLFHRGTTTTVATSTTSMMMSMMNPISEQLPSLLKQTPGARVDNVAGVRKRREKTPEICGLLDGFSLRSSEADDGDCDEKKSGFF